MASVTTDASTMTDVPYVQSMQTSMMVQPSAPMQQSVVNVQPMDPMIQNVQNLQNPMVQNVVTRNIQDSSLPPTGIEPGGNWITEKYFGPVSCCTCGIIALVFLPLSCIPICFKMDRANIYYVNNKKYTSNGIDVSNKSCDDCTCLLCCSV